MAYNIYENKKINYIRAKTMYSYNNIITFSSDWPQLNHAKKYKKNIFYLNPTRSEKNWLDLCKQKSTEFLHKESWLKDACKNKKMILFLFGTFERMSSYKEDIDGMKLLIQTIENFKLVKNAFIIIKPHANANIKKLDNVLRENNLTNFKIINMHVSVLSNYCNYAVCNYMSFALVDAWFRGVTTIEYTSYNSKILKETNNKSLYPEFVDYFLDVTDNKKFLKILNSNEPNKIRNYKANIKRNDKEKLIMKLTT